MNDFARICNVPGCGLAANGSGKCPGHKTEARRLADKRTGRVRGSRWTTIRGKVLRRDPVCRDGRVCNYTRTSTQVDHVVPLAEGGHPTSLDNLQGICDDCHLEKTRQEQREQSGWKE